MEKYNLPSNAVNDLWVAGICRDYATAVWYGYDEISSEYYNHGNGNTSLYSQLIKGVFTGTSTFTKPSSVVSVTVEKDSPGNGLLPSQYTPDSLKVTELFKAGTEPTQVSTRFAPLPDVTDLTAKLNGNKISLSWNGIGTPNALSTDYLNGLYSSTCKNVGACVSAIIGTDQAVLGSVNYQIYLKNSDGSLKLLHGTTGTSAEESIPSGNSATFVVKASYTNYGALASNGVEAKVDISNAVRDIRSSLNGQSSITITEGTGYSDAGVTVTEDGTNVTSRANIEINVNGKKVNSVHISSAGTYNIEYKIKYNNYSNTLHRTVTVKSSGNTENSGN